MKGEGRELIKFDWDKGNSDNNKKHDISDQEAEEAFFDEEKIIHEDRFHSEKEDRFIILGKTKKGELLFISYTIRGDLVRIISARRINKKEVHIYEKET